MVISSLELPQAPLLIVHLKVELAPTVNPVTPLVGDDGVVIAAVPDTTVHTPLPTAGVFPAKVAVVVLHKFWSEFALAAVAGAAIVITTSSVDAAQAPLLMVHLKVTLEGMVMPVTVELAEPGVVMVAVPETTLHSPVPVAGTLPERVVVLTLHRF